MTAPTINGTRYPQPVYELLPAARKLADELGEVPSRNRLMRTFRIGAPKADELRTRLVEEKAREIVRREQRAGRIAVRMVPVLDHPEPIGPDPAPADDRVEALRGAMAVRGALLTPRMDPADTRPEVAAEPDPTPVPVAPAAAPSTEVTEAGHPGTPAGDKPRKPLPVWPVWVLMLPAFVAVWAGWVELGKLTGFGPVDLLPGFTRDGEPLLTLDTAITLPIGMETYAGYALYIWLSGRTTRRARNFAMASALIALTLGAGAQITYHLLTTPDTGTPWQITTVVACLPVAVLGMGAALAHLVREDAR